MFRYSYFPVVIFVFFSLLVVTGCGGGTNPDSGSGANAMFDANQTHENNWVSPPIQKVQKLAVPINNKIYFGAYIDAGDKEHDVSEAKIENFEKLIQKRVAWVTLSSNWGDGIVYPKAQVHTIYRHGAIPLIRMMPRKDMNQYEEAQKADETFSLQKIIDGKFDTQLRRWAKDAKTDNVPLLLDFAPEMTGFWFSWNGMHNGGAKLDGYGDPTYPDGPERYRDAYRHIIDLFKNEGVLNVTWFFHPDIQRWPDVAWNSAKYYYPGDDYIDWVGLSIYGVQDERWEWVSFSQTLKEWYSKHIKDVTGTKPVAILEMGVTDGRTDGSKKVWLEDAFATILDNPYIDFRAVTYWHENWRTESGFNARLKIDSSVESLETFQRLIANPRFLSRASFTEN